MKKIFALIIALCSLSFIINSCREDGDEWADGGQFSYTIERDQNFIEKSVGESNQFTFNVKPSYDYSAIPMTFKFTTSLNGVLKLNGQNLTANQEYPLTNQENIFEYVGNVTGSHEVKIITKNSKNVSKEEMFTFPYGTSEFAHTFTGGTGTIYQADPTNYSMKITPNAGQPTTGYQIRFNSYTGEIKLNGVAVTTGQFYPLPNIDNFNVILSTNQVGQGALTYSIKNATVTKDYEIQQTITKREILVESMNISGTTVFPNTAMSLIGVVKKSPITPNTSVQYKTWISSASNNNMAGIQNTNNVYTPYALGANGSFTNNFNAVDVGTYTYNIQFKDEFGNESEIKSYTVKVENALTITNSAIKLFFQDGSNYSTGLVNHKITQAQAQINASAGTTNKITKIVFDCTYFYQGQQKTKSFTLDYISNPQQTVDFNSGFNALEQLYFGYNYNINNMNIANGTYTATVYDNTGATTTQTGICYTTIQ